MPEQKIASQQDFDSVYSGVPPWDIGRQQPEFQKLAEEGWIKGTVLDAGCGSGEHVLYFASLGHEAMGIDFAPSAIKIAREKAAKRKVHAEFQVADALHLEQLNRKFDNVIDCGLFHCFTDEERTQYRKSLESVLKPGGKYFLMCFSEKEPKEWGGPRRVTQNEIRSVFKEAWDINFIREAKFETNLKEIKGFAWIAGLSVK